MPAALRHLQLDTIPGIIRAMIPPHAPLLRDGGRTPPGKVQNRGTRGTASHPPTSRPRHAAEALPPLPVPSAASRFPATMEP